MITVELKKTNNKKHTLPAVWGLGAAERLLLSIHFELNASDASEGPICRSEEATPSDGVLLRGRQTVLMELRHKSNPTTDYSIKSNLFNYLVSLPIN